MTQTIAVRRPEPRRLLAVSLLAVLLAGAAASCDQGGGMYQGGRDKAPRYLRVTEGK